METSQNLLELVAAAQANAKTFEDRVSEILMLMGEENGSESQVEEFRAATVALESVVVDIFTLFEARMQHHFKRGPFSRKLRSLLLETGQTDLANRVHQYYLAINVLKHGNGASHRELLNAPSALFVTKLALDSVAEDAPQQAGLIDVTDQSFFDGLSATILEAHQFLESR